MRSITYVSTATEAFGPPELLAMLGQVRPRNEQRGITGVLLYRSGRIIQTLEGPDEAVASVFDQIVDDPRHSDIFVVLHGAIEERQFPNWCMGFENMTDVAPAEGLTSFLDEDVDEAFGGDSSVVTRMLALFRSGAVT